MESIDPTLDNILHPMLMLCVYIQFGLMTVKSIFYTSRNFLHTAFWNFAESCWEAREPGLLKSSQPHHGFHLKLEVIGNIT